MSDDTLEQDILKLARRMASPVRVDGDDAWVAVERDGVVHFYDKSGNLRAIAPAEAWREACRGDVSINVDGVDWDWRHQ